MKILLINPQKLIEPPIGFLSVAAVLERDAHDVSLVEIPVIGDGEDRAFRLEERINGAMSNKMFDAVGITCTSPDSKIVKNLCSILKRRYPDTKIVLGGIHPTVMTEESLSWGADFVVRGEGEETARELFRAIRDSLDPRAVPGIAFIKDGRAVFTVDRDVVKGLDSLPLPAYHLLDETRFLKRSYSIRGKWLKCAAIVTSRGCVGRCTFCASNMMHKRSVRWFGIDRIMEEVELFVRRYGMEGLYISDDSFTLNKDRVFDFCAELKRRNIRISWACQSRVRGLTDDMLKVMKESGLVQIEFGVESGSQRVLDMIGKDIRVEDTVKAFELCREHGLRTLANIIIGIPGETMDDISKTTELVKKIKPNFTAAFFCTPFPGTVMYDDAVRNGLIGKGRDIDWQMITEPFFSTEIPTDRLMSAYDALQKENPGFLAGYLKDGKFLADMISWTLKYPVPMAKLFGLCVSGKMCLAQSQFLKIFRKHHLNM